MIDPVLRKRWTERGSRPESAQVAALVSTLGIGEITAGILCRRGIVGEQAGKEYLESLLASLPDPFLLPDMDKGVKRLARALTQGESIVIHGDYDVDGITGTALLVQGLRNLGGRVDYHIPLRLKDGYGLSGQALSAAAQKGVSLVVSVDCGVGAVQEAAVALELGLDLIITDHHQPPDTLPAACALINPHLPNCLFPFKPLAGVGVAFFLLVALRKHLRDTGFFAKRQEPDLRLLLDLVALGTIADIVPLQGVNRTLTKVGLGLLNSSPRPGIACLQKVTGTREISSGTVGFQLAPRLNAAGRLEDAALGVDLLLMDDTEAAMELAELLDGFNKQRQKIEKETLEQAVEHLEQPGGPPLSHAIVLADERWHPGVIGIVASRLVERYHRPAVLVAMDSEQGKGSARSIPGFHLYQALQTCGHLLSGYGGHEFAAGLSIAPGDFMDFVQAFDAYAQKVLNESDLKPLVYFDDEVFFDEISLELVRELELMQPFGAANPEPVFVARRVRALGVETLKEQHLRWKACQNGVVLPCIAFGLAARAGELEEEFDMLFTPSVNEWRGRVSLQLRVKDVRPCDI